MHARLSRRIKRWSLPLYDASSQGSLNQCLLQKLTGLRAQTTTFVPVMMVMCESRHHSLNLRVNDLSGSPSNKYEILPLLHNNYNMNFHKAKDSIGDYVEDCDPQEAKADKCNTVDQG